jgi:hypothetical protein
MMASRFCPALIVALCLLYVGGCNQPPAPPPKAVTADTTKTAAQPSEVSVRQRDIVRKKLPRNLRSIALEYTVVLVDTHGKEQAVDPAEYTFELGDSFLVKIRPEDDLYVYVFNEGPEGARTCLLPAEDEQPQLVKAGTDIKLPDDGGYFTFEPPAGEEKLLVVALPQPTDDVRLLASTAFKLQGGKAGELESDDDIQAKKQADAAIESLRETSGATTRTRGPVRKVIERLDSGIGNQAISHVEPPLDGEQSSYGIAITSGNGDDPKLVLDIPLRSRGASAIDGK